MLRTPMQHDFAKLPVPEQIPRTAFKMPFKHMTTFDFSYLIPVFCTDTLPGDTWRIKGEFLARLATLRRPIMSNAFLDVHWFYAPERILWKNFRAFMGENLNGTNIGEHNIQENDYLRPVMGLSSYPGSLPAGGVGDYLGIPTTRRFASAAEMPIAAPFRMYHRIFNYWYRDRNWGAAAIAVPDDDGPDVYSGRENLNRRNMRFDYVTQALPWPQRGDAATLGIAGTAPVIGNGLALGLMGADSIPYWPTFTDNYGTNGSMQVRTAVSGEPNISAGLAPSGTIPLGDQFLGLHTNGNYSNVVADLTSLSAINIAQIREAVAMQHYLEREARIGSRYGEIILGRYGVDVQDNMIQEPEFLGSQTVVIDVRSVAQTSATSGSDAQGQLAAFSVTSGSTFIEKTTLEHGFLMCIVSARVDQVYQYGVRRMWRKRHLSEIYDHAFAHLGEQPLYNYEVYHTDNNPTLNNGVWGYIPRFDEYRHIPSMVSGLFRSEAVGTLDNWHTARKQSALIAAANYIPDNSYVDVDRVITVTTEPQIYLDMFLDITAYRPIPAYHVPGLRRL